LCWKQGERIGGREGKVGDVAAAAVDVDNWVMCHESVLSSLAATVFFFFPLFSERENKRTYVHVPSHLVAMRACSIYIAVLLEIFFFFFSFLMFVGTALPPDICVRALCATDSASAAGTAWKWEDVKRELLWPLVAHLFSHYVRPTSSRAVGAPSDRVCFALCEGRARATLLFLCHPKSHRAPRSSRRLS
jgi:hypothetical protein